MTAPRIRADRAPSVCGRRLVGPPWEDSRKAARPRGRPHPSRAAVGALRKTRASRRVDVAQDGGSRRGGAVGFWGLGLLAGCGRRAATARLHTRLRKAHPDFRTQPERAPRFPDATRKGIPIPGHNRRGNPDSRTQPEGAPRFPNATGKGTPIPGRNPKGHFFGISSRTQPEGALSGTADTTGTGKLARFPALLLQDGRSGCVRLRAE